MLQALSFDHREELRRQGPILIAALTRVVRVDKSERSRSRDLGETAIARVELPPARAALLPCDTGQARGGEGWVRVSFGPVLSWGNTR